MSNMKYLINKIKIGALVSVSMISVLSCNKDLEEIVGTPTPSTGTPIGEQLAASATDSLFYKLVVKANLVAALNNRAVSYTIFVPDNAAMIASGLSNAAVNAMPAATATSIVNYNIYPQRFPAASFPAAFPNVQISTLLGLDPTNPLVRMTSFPRKNGTQLYVNNVPVGATDIAAANGIIHKPLGLVAPPSRLLKDTMDRVSNLTYFKAAIAKADSGQTNLNRLDSLRNYAVTNMTILAPNDAAFQTLIYGMVYGKVLGMGGTAVMADAAGTAAVALGPGIFTNPAYYPDLAAANVRGIIAYHFLATNPTGSYQPNVRVFSVNFPNGTPYFAKTLVNGSVAAHPGIMAQATFTGPVVTTLTFSSYGSFPPGGAPFSYTATAVARDRHAVNGVFHIIDKVLLPQ